MREAREEMLQSLNESNLEKMRKASKGAKQTLKMKDGSIGMDSFTASAIMQIYDKVNDKNKKTMENLLKDGRKADIVKLMKFAMSKVNAEYVPEEFEEEVELDEAPLAKKSHRAFGYELYHKDFSSAMQHAYKMAKKNYGITVDPKEIDDKVASGPKKPSEGKTNSYRLKGDKGAIQVQVYNKGGSKPFELNMYKEEVELDEGKMSQLHQLIKDGKSAKEIAKIMKLDVKTIQALMDEKSELEENLDGRTREYRQHRERLELMRSKRQEARHVDPADIDTSATDDDIKAADKNIMMQLRKSVSLRGQFPVEFLDKKKVKIPQKIAQAAIAKYNNLRKPMDKEKFQSKIAKSHRDLLMALKEGFASDAQRRAAFASGYKEKDKKKKESTLERMNKKLQERQDG